MSDEVTTEVKEPKVKASKKVPLPDGYVTPVEFAKQLSEITGTEIRPQVVYGFLKGNKDFPFVEREEAPRFMVKVPEAFDFHAKKLEEKAAKADAKPAKSKKKKAAAEDAPADAADAAADVSPTADSEPF